MTAILTCTTSDFVVLASDRAVSYRSSGGNAAPSRDRIGKTVLLHGQFLLGVTGFAELDRAPITEWILERLEGVSPEIWPETLADQAGRSVGRIHRSLKDKHHMFIAIGFAPHARDPSTDTWHALRITISNALDDEGNSLDRATREFRVRSEKHPEDKWADIHAYPRHLPAETVKDAERILRRFQKKSAGAPQGSVELLARLVSGVSLRNPTVGSACLVSVLPKIALRKGNIDVPVGTAAHISDDAITCINYIGTENQRIAYMPPAIFQTVESRRTDTSHLLVCALRRPFSIGRRLQLGGDPRPDYASSRLTSRRDAWSVIERNRTYLRPLDSGTSSSAMPLR